MKKIVLVVVLLLVVAGSPALTGWIVERGADERIAAVTDQMPLLTLESRSYHGGWFSSDETITFALFKGMQLPTPPPAAPPAVPAADGSAPADPATPAAPAAPAAPIGPVLLTIHNTIHHGPLPGLMAVGLATIDSDVSVTMGGAPPAPLPDIARPRIETVLGFSGSGRTTVTSKAYADVPLKDHAKITADATELVVNFGRHFDTVDLDWKMPHVLLVQDTGTRLELSGFHATSHSHRVLRSLYAGDAEATIGSVDLTGLPSKDGAVALGAKVLHVKSQSEAHGDFLDTSLESTLSALDLAGKHVRGIKFDASAVHWQTDAFERLLSGMRDTNRTPATDVQARLAAMIKVWKTAGVDLATHDPVFTIRDVEFLTEDGFAKLSGTFSIKGAAASDFDAPFNPGKLLPKVGMEFDSSMDESLYAAMRAQATRPPEPPPTGARGKAKAPPAAPDPLQAMLAQGYVTRDNGKLRTHIVFANGALTVNGKPFPAGGGGPPPVAPR